MPTCIGIVRVRGAPYDKYETGVVESCARHDTLVTGCEKRPEAERLPRLAHAGQRSSAEGLALVGLYALKKLRECSEHPDDPCAFRYEAEASVNRLKHDNSSSPAKFEN
jgi:hypothetical protein